MKNEIQYSDKIYYSLYRYLLYVDIWSKSPVQYMYIKILTIYLFKFDTKSNLVHIRYNICLPKPNVDIQFDEISHIQWLSC